MTTFWHWLLALAKTRIHSAHLKCYGADTRCPRCKEWHSVTQSTFGGCTDQNICYVVACNQCDEQSRWNFDAPIPIRRVRNNGPMR